MCYLVERYNPVIGFSQSDEITLVFVNTDQSAHPFGGKLFKMKSLLPKHIPEKVGTLPSFDGIVKTLPSTRLRYNVLRLLL